MTDLDPPRVKAGDPLAPAISGPLTLTGLVTDELIDFHRRPAAGEVGMTTQDMYTVAVYGGTHCVLDPKPANPPVPA